MAIVTHGFGFYVRYGKPVNRNFPERSQVVKVDLSPEIPLADIREMISKMIPDGNVIWNERIYTDKGHSRYV